MSTTSAATPRPPLHIKRPDKREGTNRLDVFELIRQQAHEALNAIRAGCREDLNSILNRGRATER